MNAKINEIQKVQIKADLLELIDYIEKEKGLSLNDISEEFVEIIEKNIVVKCT